VKHLQLLLVAEADKVQAVLLTQEVVRVVPGAGVPDLEVTAVMPEPPDVQPVVVEAGVPVLFLEAQLL
jgi:hypothetical protein